MSSKIEENLGRDEHVVLNGKISWAVVVPHFILMLVLIGFFTVWKPLVAKLTTHLCVTNKKVIGKVGFIKIKTLDAPLNKINNVAVQQGFIARIIGYGTVRIDTSSGTYHFNYIKHPNDFKSELFNQIDVYDNERIKKQAQMMADATRNTNI